MPLDHVNRIRDLSDEVVSARRAVAVASARLAEAAVQFADARTAADVKAGSHGDRDRTGPGAARPGEFVADEVSLLLREQPYSVRCLLARSRRLAADLPTVWRAYGAGELDAEQTRVIDRVARRVTEAATLAAIDSQAVAAAQTRSPKQLAAWLLRLVVQCEPLAFAHRHRRALAERRVTVVQGVDGVGYVTGEVSATDAAAVDAMLTAAARSLGKDDPRSEQQRRSDMFVDLLLGRLRLTEPDDELDDEGPVGPPSGGAAGQPRGADIDGHRGESGESAEVTEDVEGAEGADAGAADERSEDAEHARGAGTDPQWLEVEDIDLDTGELLGTRWQRLDGDGEPLGDPVRVPPPPTGPLAPTFARRPERLRIGVVVPLSSLLGLTNTPAELTDRSALIPADTLRQLIADLVKPDRSKPDQTSADQVLFTRLLTDDGGRLLDTTELGRHPSRRLAEAIQLRAGTCRYPTCTVAADRCDLDHHDPVPKGATKAANLDPLCRRHHRGKTFAWLANRRDHDAVDWTMPDAHHYRCVDEPLPTGLPGRAIPPAADPPGS
jgi:hypothetical protein